MSLDPFREEIASLPDQFLASPEVRGEALPPGETLLAGLGGSGFAAEFAALRLPGIRHAVLRDAVLPPAVGRGDRVICVSCSGNTAEMLEVFDAARERGASVGVVTRGGELLKRAEKVNSLRVVVPGDQSPRASLGYLLRGVLTALGGETPVWEEIKAVDDLAVDPQVADIAVNDREADTGHLHGKTDSLFSFTLLEDIGDTNVETMIAALIDDSAMIHLALSRGVIATSGVKYWHAECVLFGGLTASQGDAASYDVEARRHANSDNGFVRATAA